MLQLRGEREREWRVEIMTEIRKNCLFDKAIEKSTVLRIALNSSHKPPNWKGHFFCVLKCECGINLCSNVVQ